jgi:tetratricopeptide (TPR) repeat protein
MTTTPSAPSARAARRPGQLWQVPVFLLGVSALAAAAAGSPLGGDAAKRTLERHLAAARHHVARGDGEAAEADARQAVALAAAAPELAGEARYLLGTALLVRADHAAAGDAAALYREARTELEEADRLGVPEDDRGRLSYRLGKAGFHAGDDPARVAERLAEAARTDQADDPADAYGMLTQAYLRQSPPNLPAALDANDKLRQVPLQDERVLAPARLLAGELLTKLNKPDEAAKVLALVHDTAPPDVLNRARLLRARLHQDEGKWAEAAALWQAALADPRYHVPDRAAALYQLGVCCRRTDQPEDAARAWEECRRTAAGPEGAAAALALAELRADDHPEQAAELLAAVAAAPPAPPDGAGPSADPARARELFEKVGRALGKAGRFDEALAAAGPYARLAEPGRAEALRAALAADWARRRREKARELAAANKPADEEEKAARELFGRAAADYQKVAEAASEPAGRAEPLWQAALCLREAKDLPQAAAALDRFLKLEQGLPAERQSAARQSEAWYLLGETRREAGDRAKAEEAYAACISVSVAGSSPFPYRARFELAKYQIADGNLDKAVETLEQNLGLLRYDPDAKAQDDSLFTLGHVLYQRGDFRGAQRRLEEALGALRRGAEGQEFVPSGPDVTRAWYELAESYRQVANQAMREWQQNESRTAGGEGHLKEEYRRWTQKAAEEYEALARFLDKPASAGHLSEEERLGVPFLAADCRFNLGEYDLALEAYEKLAARHPGQTRAGLNALGGTVRCHVSLNQPEKAHRRLGEIRAALAGVTDEELRKEWEGWLTVASKPTEP